MLISSTVTVATGLGVTFQFGVLFDQFSDFLSEIAMIQIIPDVTLLCQNAHLTLGSYKSARSKLAFVTLTVDRLGGRWIAGRRGGVV